MNQQYIRTAPSGAHAPGTTRSDGSYLAERGAAGTHSEFSMSGFLRTLRSHWGKSTLLMIAMLAITAAALMFAPRKYESESKLFVRLGRESVGLDPTATTGQTLTVNRLQESELNSIAQLLLSRNLAEQVVDQIGPEQVLNPEPVEVSPGDGLKSATLDQLRGHALSLIGTGVQWIRDLDPISDRDRAIDTVVKSIDVEVPKLSNVVNITCKSQTPELARDVVASLVTAYMDEHVRVNSTAGAYDFFDDQTKVLRLQLESAVQAFRDAKNESGVLSVENQREMLHKQLTQNLADRLRVEAALEGAQEQLASFGESVETVDSLISTDQVSGMDNAAADRMREKLYELEMRKAELLAQYTREHPLVAAIEKQVTDAKAIFDQQPESRTHATLAVNTNHQALELNLLNERARTAALEAELATLERQQVQLDERRATLNSDETRLDELQRQVNVLEAGYTAHMQSRELSRINEALDVGRISNVTVAQPATFVPKPASPNKLLLLVLGLALAFGGAILLPFVLGPKANNKAKSPPPTQPRKSAASSQADVEAPPELVIEPMRHREPMVVS